MFGINFDGVDMVQVCLGLIQGVYEERERVWCNQLLHLYGCKGKAFKFGGSYPRHVPGVNLAILGFVLQSPTRTTLRFEATTLVEERRPDQRP